jgi:hypothetical protein
VALLRARPYRTHAWGGSTLTACPACASALHGVEEAVCDGCGLHWIRPGAELTPIEAEGSGRSASVRVSLRKRASTGQVVSWLGMVAVGVLGSIAAGSAAWDALPAGSDLVLLLLVVPVGAWITVCCAACVLDCALQAAIPSRVDGDDVHLRVRVWRRWTGILDGLRRTDVCIPRDRIAGAGLREDPLGQSQLFVLHASGYAFGTGWRGTEQEGRRLAQSVARWLGPVG